MFKSLTQKPSFTLFLLFLLLLLPALACGSDTPTKVGEVESEATTAEPVAETEEEATAEPTAQPAPSDTSEPAEPTAPPTAATTTFATGDIIDFGDLSMIVLGWSSPAGDEFSQPDAGNKFVVVDTLFVNTGSAADSLSSLLQTQLKDGTSQVYNPDFNATLAAGVSSPDGEISPGERIRGSIGFQVPQDATGLQFVFDASFLGGQRVFVNLGDEPVSVPAPETIEGETGVTPFEVGDIIEIGDLSLVVNAVTFPTGDDFNKPDDGKKFVAVDLSVTNNSAESQAISSLIQMDLKDATGQVYDVDFTASLAAGGASPDGELAPGETLRGQVGFQVPTDAQGLQFAFDGELFGGGKVFVNLPNQ